MGKRSFLKPPIGPSRIPVSIGGGLVARAVQRCLMGTPDEMTRAQIDEVVQKFAEAADVMARAGFAGVEIHGSHGYLVSSFLSPKSNQRTDDYGATPKDRMKFLFQVIDAIRAVVPRTFAVGVKLNSADFSAGGLTEDEAADQIRWLDEHGGIDFIEISGGTYESPVMMGDEKPLQSTRTRRREAYFLEFAGKVRHTTSIPLIVTGGFRTRKGMNDAIRSNACDFVGIGRPACVQFNLPEILLDKSIPDDQARALPYEIRGTRIFDYSPIAFVGSGVGTLWHNWQMHRVAIEGRDPDPTLTVHGKTFSIVWGLVKKFAGPVLLVVGVVILAIFLRQNRSVGSV